MLNLRRTLTRARVQRDSRKRRIMLELVDTYSRLGFGDGSATIGKDFTSSGRQPVIDADLLHQQAADKVAPIVMVSARPCNVLTHTCSGGALSSLKCAKNVGSSGCDKSAARCRGASSWRTCGIQPMHCSE